MNIEKNGFHRMSGYGNSRKEFEVLDDFINCKNLFDILFPKKHYFKDTK